MLTDLLLNAWPALAVLFAAVLGAGLLAARRPSRQPTAPPSDPVREEARAQIDARAEEATKKIDRAVTGPDPAGDLARLGDARRRGR